MTISRTTEYAALINAIHRCHNPNHSAYPKYGARGITVCPEWRDIKNGGFYKFIGHIGYKPDGTSLDRIDNNKGYEPGNVRWATRKEQQNNLSSNNDIDRELLEQVMKQIGSSRAAAIIRIKRYNETGDENLLTHPIRSRTNFKRKVRIRKPAILKKPIRNRGENRTARNEAIAKDWDAHVRSKEIAARYGISHSALLLIVKGKL